MTLNYTTYTSTMATMLAVSSTSEVNFVQILPSMIAYAETRIYQDIDFTKAHYEYTRACTPNQRAVTMPDSGSPNNTPIFIIESADVISPAGSSIVAGKRNGLQRVSKQFLDFVYPSASATGLPIYYTLSDDAVQLGPTPDAAYLFVASGPIRPLPLSASNPTTWLLTNIEPLFIAASMVFGSGFQKNFGAQSDDPKMAISWESQYQTLLKSAGIEELRRKAAAQGWQAIWPEPLGPQPRT